MYIQQQTLGTICIAFGILLFMSVAGEWLFKFSMALLAIYLIQYGLQLRGMPSLTITILRWFDRTRYY